jgi:hypothetical protein
MLDGCQPNVFKYTSINAWPIKTNEFDGETVCLDTFEFRHMQTPEFGGDITSVTAGLSDIFKYACMCTSIVDWAYGNILEEDTISTTISRWTEHSAHMWAYANRRQRNALHLNQDAVLNLLDRFHGSAVVPYDVDKTSLVAVSPHQHEPRRYNGPDTEMEVDEGLLEMVREAASEMEDIEVTQTPPPPPTMTDAQIWHTIGDTSTTTEES